MERWFCVTPNWGMCNKLMVYLSAKVLAERAKRKLILNWQATGGCGARFDQLFANPEHACVMPPRNVLDHGKPEFWSALYGPTPEVSIEAGFWLIPWKEIGVCYPHFEALRPRPEVQALIDTVSIPPNTVGVHVRRGDMVGYFRRRFGRHLAPLRDFFPHIDGAEHIFLATDDPGVELLMRHRYGDRVITYPKRSYRRCEVEQAQDGLVDLILLRKCSRVVSTWWSSFSFFAGWRKPHITVGGMLPKTHSNR